MGFSYVIEFLTHVQAARGGQVIIITEDVLRYLTVVQKTNPVRLVFRITANIFTEKRTENLSKQNSSEICKTPQRHFFCTAFIGNVLFLWKRCVYAELLLHLLHNQSMHGHYDVLRSF